MGPDWMPPFSQGADDASALLAPRLSLALQECRVHYRFPAPGALRAATAGSRDGSLSTLAKERPEALLVLGHPLILFRRAQRLLTRVDFMHPPNQPVVILRTTTVVLVAALSFGERPCDFCQQAIELEWLSVTVIATRGQRLLAIAHHGVGGEGDDGNVARCRIGLKSSRRLPTVNYRKVQIHENYIGPLGDRLGDPFGSVHRGDHLVPAERFETQRQRIQIVVIVLNIEKLDHY
jgi:hypothetical protein